MSETSTNNGDKNSATNKVLKILAYPISFATGLFVTKTNLSDAAYNQFKHYGGIEQLRTQGAEGMRQILEEGAHNALLGISNSGLPDKVVEHRANYFPKFEARKKAFGINNIVDEWKIAHRSEKHNAVINGIMVTAVVLGALLEVTNSKMFNNFFSKKDSSPGSNER